MLDVPQPILNPEIAGKDKSKIFVTTHANGNSVSVQTQIGNGHVAEPILRGRAHCA